MPYNYNTTVTATAATEAATAPAVSVTCHRPGSGGRPTAVAPIAAAAATTAEIVAAALMITPNPANTRHSPNAGTILAYRLRHWANIVPTLGERLVFDGKGSSSSNSRPAGPPPPPPDDQRWSAG